MELEEGMTLEFPSCFHFKNSLWDIGNLEPQVGNWGGGMLDRPSDPIATVGSCLEVQPTSDS